jgi:hypothetical protein
MSDGILARISAELTWGGVLLGASLFLLSLAGSLLLVGFLLVRLPATYFQDFHPRDIWTDRHPALRVTARIAKNALGIVLVLVGAILTLPGVPGQGVLTILVGLMLLDLPGKRRLERRIVGRPRILRAINRLRHRFGKPPLVLGRLRGAMRQGEITPGRG